DMILDWTGDVIEGQVLEYCDSNDTTKWNISGLTDWFKGNLGFEPTVDIESIKRQKDTQFLFYNQLAKSIQEFYDQKVASVSKGEFEYVERRITLDIIDIRWKEHLYQMDQLREGIWTTSYSERNPLVEYKIQGFQIFETVLDSIKSQIIEALFRIQIVGPVEREQSVSNRNQGQEQHTQLESFGSGNVAGAMKPNQKEANPTIVSGGGASRRRGSRRNRRK
ncbi:MAG: preprotein translocase subunit SecA, partial [Leptonema sp. (in: Bacteria)]|nr:preprotein translocase subunit SecA [Leptonema sp. (in: bacteria)]